MSGSGWTADPPGHGGHLYRVEVTVSGEWHPDTQMVIDLPTLDEILTEQVAGPLAGRHLGEVDSRIRRRRATSVVRSTRRPGAGAASHRVSRRRSASTGCASPKIRHSGPTVPVRPDSCHSEGVMLYRVSCRSAVLVSLIAGLGAGPLAAQRTRDEALLVIGFAAGWRGGTALWNVPNQSIITSLLLGDGSRDTMSLTRRMRRPDGHCPGRIFCQFALWLHRRVHLHRPGATGVVHVAARLGRYHRATPVLHCGDVRRRPQACRCKAA